MQPIPAKQGGAGASSLSAALDAAFGSTQGSVLYRGASGWAALGPGTSGQVLQTAGSGANPSWATMSTVGTGGVTTSGSPASGQFAMFSSATAISTATAGPNLVLAGPASGTASGTVTARALVQADLPVVGLADGCCRIAVSSTTVIKMVQVNGSTLIINGVAQTIPSGGVSLTVTGLTAYASYYVYAYMSGTTMALALSQTGYTQDASGRINMSGNAAYRLVGNVLTAASGNLDTALTSCISWFSRKILRVSQNITTQTASTTSVAATAVAVAAWKGEQIRQVLTGYVQISSAGQTSVYTTQYNEDTSGAQASNSYVGQGVGQTNCPTANGSFAVSLENITSVTTEGRHAVGINTYTTGGTETFAAWYDWETWG